MESRYLSLDEMIASINLTIDSDDSRDDGIYAEWIYDAMQEIGASNLDVRSKTVPVVNFSFEKPCDLCYPLELNLLNEHCASVPYNAHLGWLHGQASIPLVPKPERLRGLASDRDRHSHRR